jgi:hypothetical protein
MQYQHKGRRLLYILYIHRIIINITTDLGCPGQQVGLLLPGLGVEKRPPTLLHVSLVPLQLQVTQTETRDLGETHRIKQTETQTFVRYTSYHRPTQETFVQ